MKPVLLLIAVFACLGNQNVLAQTCYSNLRCTGATTGSGATYDQCCGPVVQNNALSRSFKSGSTCSPCYVLGLVQASYTLSESNIVHFIRLRVLSPTDPAGFIYGRPRLRLKGIPGGTATTDDFSLPSSDILIRSFSGTDVPVTLSVDGIAGETTESFVITSQQPLVSDPGDSKFLFRTTTINIRDADRASYEFLLTEYAKFEGSDSPCDKVTVIQTSSLVESDVHLLVTPLTYTQYTAQSSSETRLGSIDVYHSSRPGPATYDSTSSGKRDFNNAVQKLTFSAGSEAGAIYSVNIEVFDDNTDEYVEGFILVLDVDTTQTSFGVSFAQSKQTALVRIYDNDPFFFGFEQQEFILNEQLDEGLQDIFLSAAPGNATEKSFHYSLDLNSIKGDFSFGLSGDYSFGLVGSSRPFFRFDQIENIVVGTVINDDIAEGEEIGQLRIVPNIGFDGSAAPRFQSVRIIMVDDDAAILTLSAPSTVRESAGSFLATITLTLPTNAGLTSALHVDILDAEKTATQSVDYSSPTPSSVNFQGSIRVLTVSCSVTDDNIAEPDEILSLTIQRSTIGAQTPVSYSTKSVDIKIIDNDVARIGFETTAMNVVEGDSATLNITVLGNIVLGRNVVVRFSTADGTAINGADYTNTVAVLTFNATATSYDVLVPINRDGELEGNENFRAELQVIENTNNIGLTVGPASAVVTIARNGV